MAEAKSVDSEYEVYIATNHNLGNLPLIQKQIQKAIQIAINSKDLKLVETLLPLLIDPNFDIDPSPFEPQLRRQQYNALKYDPTLLLLACTLNARSLVKALLKTNKFCMGSTMEKIMSGEIEPNKEMLKLFLDAGFDPGTDNECIYNTAISAAIDYNLSADLVEMLIRSSSIDINNMPMELGVWDDKVITPLTLAATRKRWDLVNLLISYNAKFNRDTDELDMYLLKCINEVFMQDTNELSEYDPRKIEIELAKENELAGIYRELEALIAAHEGRKKELPTVLAQVEAVSALSTETLSIICAYECGTRTKPAEREF